jgi:hypothetical protein
MDIALSMDSLNWESSILIVNYLKNKKPFTKELGKAFHRFPYGRVFPIPSSGYTFFAIEGCWHYSK